jgi:hypothetical protein
MDNRLPIPASHSQIYWQVPFNTSPTWGTLHYWTCGSHYDTWEVLIMRISGKKTLIWYQCEKLKHGADHEKIWRDSSDFETSMRNWKSLMNPPFSQVKAANDIRRVIKIRIVQKGLCSDVSHTPIYFMENNDWVILQSPRGQRHDHSR